jgi:hypothetical protein
MLSRQHKLLLSGENEPSSLSSSLGPLLRREGETRLCLTARGEKGLFLGVGLFSLFKHDCVWIFAFASASAVAPRLCLFGLCSLDDPELRICSGPCVAVCTFDLAVFVSTSAAFVSAAFVSAAFASAGFASAVFASAVFASAVFASAVFASAAATATGGFVRRFFRFLMSATSPLLHFSLISAVLGVSVSAATMMSAAAAKPAEKTDQTCLSP